MSELNRPKKKNFKNHKIIVIEYLLNILLNQNRRVVSIQSTIVSQTNSKIAAHILSCTYLFIALYQNLEAFCPISFTDFKAVGPMPFGPFIHRFKSYQSNISFIHRF